MAAMLRDVVVVVHRRWAYAPAIHSAIHVYHEKRGCVGFSRHACGCVSIMILHLVALRAVRAPLWVLYNILKTRV